WNHANSICAANLDLDQDTDLIGTASYAGEVAWFENDGNQSFTKHNIFETWARPSCAETADIDSDDDIDIVATVCYLNQVLWFENDGSQTFTPLVIDSNFTRPHQVRTADLDNDDDIDVIATAIDNDQIAWWENGEGNPVQWTKHVITDNFNGATGIHIFDIDRDNDLDVLGAAQFGNKISWWENVPAGIEEKSITQIKQPNPIPTILSNQLKLEENKNWKFYDIIGRNISTNNIKPGIYLLVIDGIIAQKVIKIK
ncbi:MAG: T9SS type A sorting domain-containing protein, partial [bacterium]